MNHYYLNDSCIIIGIMEIEKYRSILYKAIKSNDIPMIEFIVNREFDKKYYCHGGFNGPASNINLFNDCYRGPNSKKQNKIMATVLSVAIESNHGLISYFLELGANPNQRLYTDSESSKSIILDAIKYGVPVDKLDEFIYRGLKIKNINYLLQVA